MCGGTIEVTEGQKVVTCEYCGATQTVHSFDNEKKTTFFKRAEALRFKCEFDKAAGVYETIVSEFPHEAEAYWGLVLCKYGIEYVDDPKTGKKIPTCHRTQFASIYEDADYINVLKYADVVAKTVYEQEAKEISKLQKSILDISSKEDPFDIFICYKENDSRGNRTKDSVLAQDIYDELISKGYRVFFSRITLEDKLGTQYEPYIFAALHSAKIMLHVTTSDENSESVWVRNEWSRYLSLIADGQRKTLIPCYKDITAYDLPEEMQNLQGQDMSKLGAMQDLLRGIEKILNKKTTVKVEKTIVESTGSHSSYVGLIKKGHTYLRNHKFDEANKTFDEAIRISEMPGEAYLGKVLAEYQFSSIEELMETASEDVVDNDNYVLAKEFANEEFAKQLKEIEDKLRYNRLKENYDSATRQYQQGDIESLSLAADNFRELGDFEDSPTMVKECIYKKGQVYLSFVRDISSISYCENAIKCFEEVGSFKNSHDMINLVASTRERIINEYKESCVSKLSITYPKDVTNRTLKELTDKVLLNRKTLKTFNPLYKEVHEVFKNIEAEAIKFFNEKTPALIQTFSQKSQCYELKQICKTIEVDSCFKSIYDLIHTRENELNDIARAIAKKRRKKGLTIFGIVSASLAVVIASIFGIKAIVEETNRSNTYNAATNYMESGNYDDAIAYYQSLGDYKESQKKIKVCEGLKQLEASISSKKEADAIKGIKTIVSAGEKVDVAYETENNVNIKRLADSGNSGNKTETINDVNFTFYQPTWIGYEFIDWNSNSLYYKNNLTHLGLMSNWSINYYTISYILNGGLNSDSNPDKYTVEDEITFKDATKKGYTFLGWVDSKNDPINKVNKGSTGNLSLSATWNDGNEYMVHLDPNGGAVSTNIVNVKYDASFSLPTPSRNGCTFSGWYIGQTNEKLVDGIWNYTTDITAVAKWDYIVYNISYSLDGGTNSPDNPSEYNVDDLIVLKDPSKKGYTFLGWKDSSNQTVSQIPKGSTGDISLFATWNDGNEYVLYLNPNGGTISETSINVKFDANYTVPTPEKNGYTFLGWFDDATNIQIQDGIWNFDKNIHATAHWDTISYSISYNLNGGTNHPSNPLSYTIESDDIVINNPSRAGYTFKGWDSTLGEKQYQPKILHGSTGNMTFTSNWDANLNTIVFHGNGATSGSTDSMQGYSDSTVILNANGFIKTGYHFSGWSETSDGSVVYADSATITVPCIDSYDLYAIWSPNLNTITFHSNTGSGSMDNQEMYSDSVGNLNTNTYTKTGYSFAGWSYTPDGEVEYENGDDYAMGTNSNYDLYAIWSPNTYYISLDCNGGSCSGSEYSYPAVYDSNYSLPVPGRAGYEFVGWFKGNTQITTSDGQSLDVWKTASNATVVAHWTANLNKIYLHDNAIGNTIELDGYTDTAIRLPDNTFIKSGYAFSGWKCGNDYYYDGDLFFVGSSPTYDLYAQWTSETGYTKITNVTQLRNMDSSGKYLLANDIDLENANWECNFRDFTGEFNGNGHTIYNFNIVVSTNYDYLRYNSDDQHIYYYAGLFKDNKGTIKNLCITNVTFNISNATKGHVLYPDGDKNLYYLYMGGICGVNSGTIQNCVANINANIELHQLYYYYFGGICGINNSTIEDVKIGFNFKSSGTLQRQSTQYGGWWYSVDPGFYAGAVAGASSQSDSNISNATVYANLSDTVTLYNSDGKSTLSKYCYGAVGWTEKAIQNLHYKYYWSLVDVKISPSSYSNQTYDDNVKYISFVIGTSYYFCLSFQYEKIYSPNGATNGWSTTKDGTVVYGLGEKVGLPSDKDYIYLYAV